MIAAFLSPYAFRGVSAPYLWVFYKLLSSIDEPMAFLLSADYLEPCDSAAMKGRTELGQHRQIEHGYALPDAAILELHRFSLLDPELMTRLLPRFGGNPLAFFKAFLSEDVPEIRQALETGLSSLPDDIEVILSWSNCPSLSAVAAARGIPIVHLEVGPLREPQYRPTAYFDFSGVNGNTEAARRYENDPGVWAQEFDVPELHRAFSSTECEERSPGNRLGVVLQVEDDSNLISFSNGFDNASLIAKALLENPHELPLIRSHPGSRFQVRQGVAEHDSSATVLDFLAQCKKVVCVNSSVGLEALMLELEVDVEGDASYGFVVREKDPRQRGRKLAYFLLGYLVPYSQVFSADYIRFRLGRPAEAEIAAMHLRGHGLEQDSGSAKVDVRQALRHMAKLRIESTRADAGAEEAEGPQDGWLLSYRTRTDDGYADDLSVRPSSLVSDGAASVVRFVLPSGARPEVVRVSAPALAGCNTLRAMRWGWGSEARGELSPLFDTHLRLISASCAHFRDGEAMSLLNDGGEVYFEFSVDDLWSSAAARASPGHGVLEFVLSYQSADSAIAHELFRIREGILGQGRQVGEASMRDEIHRDIDELSSRMQHRSSQLAQIRAEFLESIHGQSVRLNDLSATVEKMCRSFESLAEVQASQSDRLADMAARIEGRLGLLLEAQDLLKKELGDQAEALGKANANIDEMKRISEMTWRQKYLAKWTKKGQA